jgi:uncharacterized lipoprotein YmbA
MVRRAACMTAAALVACACSTPQPLTLHTLMPADLAPAQLPTLAIELLPVGVPAALDQQPIVLRQGAGELRLLERERWAAPLGEELRSALAVLLGRALAARDVSGLPRPPDALRIKVEVRRFESAPGSHALLDADWSVARGAEPQRLLCHSEQRAGAGPGVAALVRAHQQALQAMAEDIAAAIRAGACRQR